MASASPFGGLLALETAVVFAAVVVPVTLGAPHQPSAVKALAILGGLVSLAAWADVGLGASFALGRWPLPVGGRVCKGRDSQRRYQVVEYHHSPSLPPPAALRQPSFVNGRRAKRPVEALCGGGPVGKHIFSPFPLPCAGLRSPARRFRLPSAPRISLEGPVHCSAHRQARCPARGLQPREADQHRHHRLEGAVMRCKQGGRRCKQGGRRCKLGHRKEG